MKTVTALKEGIKSGKNLAKSISETVRKPFRESAEIPKLKGQREPVAESIESTPQFAELQNSLRNDLVKKVMSDEQNLRNSLGKNELKRRQVTAGMLDSETGTISEAYQNLSEKPVLDPILENRIKQLENLEPRVGRHPSALGTHAEIFAANDLIKARRAKGMPIDLSKFVSYQRWLSDPSNSAKMCWNCSLTLPEVESMPGKNWKYPPDKR